jgi:hypothetical protein
MRVLRGGWIHSRAGPQEFLFTPDVSLRAEDLDPAGPPWLESRGPPGIYRDLGRPVGLAVAKVATAALIERSNYASAPNFPAVGRPNLKHGVLQHALAKRGTVPFGNVPGARNRRHLTGLPEWKWIRQAKVVTRLVLMFHTRS